MKKILIIEDNFEMRENIAELLELSGYQVTSEPNGKAGVKNAIANLPELIICDIMMPEMDGYEVLHILSKNPTTSHIPFLFLSAKSAAKDMRKGMNLGADDYLTKPFEELDLLNAIETRFKRNLQLSQGQEKGNSQTLQNILNDASSKHIRAKEAIYEEGEHFRNLYYIVKGQVKSYKSHDAGKEMTTKLYGNGDWFGLSAIFDIPIYDHGALAIVDTELKLVPREQFLEALFCNKQLITKVLSEVLIEKGQNEEKLVKLAYDSVRRRVADALLSIHDKFFSNGESVKMKIPRDDIASMAGTSTESAIRMLSEFKDAGLISISKEGISILQLEKLRKAPY